MRSRQLYEEMSAIAPNDKYSEAESARSLNNLGLAQASTGAFEAARTTLERGRQLREALRADQPANIEYQADLARSFYQMAHLEALDHPQPEAREAIRKAEELDTGIPTKGPEDISFLACLKAMRAVLDRAAPSDAGPAAADEAVQLLQPAAAQGHGNQLRLRNEPALTMLHERPDFKNWLDTLDRESR